jgi:hypothetical protein
MGSVSYGARGTIAYGSTSVAPTYPTGIVANDLLVLVVATKPATATVATPSGWNPYTTSTGTTGVNGTGTGPTKLWTFLRDAVGTESGSLGIGITSGNSSWGVIHRVRAADGGPLTGDSRAAQDTTDGTAHSIAYTVTTNWVRPGDLLLNIASIPKASVTWSAESMTATGVTFGTAVEAGEATTTTGNDSGGIVWYAPVTSGTNSGTTITADATLSATSYGPGILFLAREFRYAVSGTAPATSDAFGDVTKISGGGGGTVYDVSGTASIVSGGTGTVSRLRAVSGTAPVTSAATAAPKARRSLGTARAAIVSGASLTVTKVPKAVSGMAAITTTAFASPTFGAVSKLPKPVSGTAQIISGASAAPKARRALGVARAASVSGAFGAVDKIGGSTTHPISGMAAIVSGASLNVRVRRAVSGTAPVASTAFGDPKSKYGTQGLAAITSTVSLDAKALRAVMGAANTSTTAFGAVSLVGPVVVTYQTVYAQGGPVTVPVIGANTTTAQVTGGSVTTQVIGGPATAYLVH